MCTGDAVVVVRARARAAAIARAPARGVSLTSCTRYLRRAFARISRLPKSRCAATMALAVSIIFSLGTKPRWSAVRANVVSLPCVRPMPPPTITLKPMHSVFSSFMMTTRPMSFV